MASRTITSKTSRNNTSVSTSNKPFCGVCFNSGKTEKEYTSHFTKSVAGSKGLVLCPTILQHTCEYCKEKGHFKGNCRILKQKEKTNQIDINDFKQNNHKNTQKNLQKTTINKTVFELAFGEDDDDNKERGVSRNAPKEVVFIPKQYKISYSMVTKKPVKNKTNDEPSLFDYVVKKPVKNVFHSWADDEYWESDDE
jgi:hypothetical protein